LIDDGDKFVNLLFMYLYNRSHHIEQHDMTQSYQGHNATNRQQ